MITLLCAAVGGARVLFADAVQTQLTSESYACKEHLIAQWDAIENAGRGAHSDKPTSWVELVGGISVSGSQNLTYNDKSVKFSGAQYFTCHIPALKTALANKSCTVEMRLRPTSYVKYGGIFQVESLAARELILDQREETGSGSAKCAFGGTIELRGDCSNLAVGDHTVLKGTVTRGEAWTCVTTAPHRIFKVKVGENGLVLRVSCPGMMLLVK